MLLDHIRQLNYDRRQTGIRIINTAILILICEVLFYFSDNPIFCSIIILLHMIGCSRIVFLIVRYQYIKHYVVDLEHQYNVGTG